MRVLILAMFTFMLSGCVAIGEKALDLNATYSNAKRTYIDTKHVLYEIKADTEVVASDIKAEKEFWKSEAKDVYNTIRD